MVESMKGWRPSGWLGIVVAGALWTSLRDASEMDSSIRSLVEQINGAVPGSGDAESEDDDHDYEEEVITVDDGASLRAELDRLRQATEAKPVAEAFTYDQDAPALVPVGVPQLPNDFQRTDATDRLSQNLVLSSTPTTAGFFGQAPGGSETKQTGRLDWRRRRSRLWPNRNEGGMGREMEWAGTDCAGRTGWSCRGQTHAVVL